MAKKRKVILTVAQTGGFQGKDMNPAIPEQPAEIIQSAYDCYNAGASIVHVHAREKDGRGSNNPDIFAEINTGIRAKCPIVIQNSMAPGAGGDRDSGLKILDMDKACLPEMASLDIAIQATTFGGHTEVQMWTRDWLIASAQRLVDLGIKAELEVFGVEAIEDVFNYLVPAGVIPNPISMTFVMGMNKVSQGAISYSNKNLDMMLGMIPHGADVSLTTMAIGSSQLHGVMYGLLKGTNVRTGMEDNIYYRYRELAKSNAQLVERMVHLIHTLDMEVATPDEARDILGLARLKDFAHVRGNI